MASEDSDHCPLLLGLQDNKLGRRRFHFESFWPKLEGFQDTIADAWASVQAGPCPFLTLDFKFKAATKALQSWSDKTVGHVNSQLALKGTPTQNFSNSMPVTARGRISLASLFQETKSTPNMKTKQDWLMISMRIYLEPPWTESAPSTLMSLESAPTIWLTLSSLLRRKRCGTQSSSCLRIKRPVQMGLLVGFTRSDGRS